MSDGPEEHPTIQIGDHRIPVSERFAEEVREYLDGIGLREDVEVLRDALFGATASAIGLQMALDQKRKDVMNGALVSDEPHEEER